MLRYTILLLVVVCIGELGCSRNLLSLPEPVQNSVFDTTIGSGSQRQLTLHFFKKGFAGRDSLLLSVQNLSQTSYNNLQIMIEIATDKPGNFDQVLLHQPVTIALLDGNATSPYTIISSDTSLPLSGHLLTGIVSYDGAAQPLAGDYDNVSILFYHQDTIKHHGQVKGYILNSGESLFRIHQLDLPQPYYTLNGVFTDTAFFDGSLYDNAASSVFTTQLTPLPSGRAYDFNDASKQLSFKLKLLTSASDSVDQLLITAHKN